ncbi:hypothetical protein [Phenylobacterium sp.]|uniref:hypothetical protein n=1 Tax=Phenylobacterium sp. TaxID=1871053 RepID=UPI00391A444C
MAHAQDVMQVTAGFLLDQVRDARQPLDLLDALISVTVTQANVEMLMRDLDLQRTYATCNAPPPDELRRPISINAVAQSLQLPFETVRRRIARLSLFGAYRSTREGVYVPELLLKAPGHRKALRSAYDRLSALYGRLLAMGELTEIDDFGPRWEGDPPLRAVGRISSEYLLRFVEPIIGELGDAVNATVWLEILRSNTEAGNGVGWEEVERRPVGISQVARRVGLPVQTVRRRVEALVAAGACARAGRGVFAPAETLRRPEFMAIAEKNRSNLERMFANLGRLGVLAAWREAIEAKVRAA